jgi:hypothetical protein
MIQSGYSVGDVRPQIRSAAFSPIIITGRLVLPEGRAGMKGFRGLRDYVGT